MTQYLPPNLLALFAPRDPIPYIPPLDKLVVEKKLTPYTGVGQFLLEFEDPKDTPPPTKVETKDERKERKRKERAEQVAYKLEQDLALWDPANDPQSTGDPFKSLFIGRINYDTSESKLRREFEVYGTVKRINMVVNKVNAAKPKGYAFVEYEHERDMHSAYKHADGKKIDGRRVLVDVERSRTVKGWRPRRLGGGLGGTRKGGPDVNTKYSGRDDGAGMHRDDRSRSRERGGGGGRRDRSKSRDKESRDRGGRRAERSRSPRSEKKRRSRSPREREPARRDRGDRNRDRAERFDEEAAVEEERPTRRRRRSRSNEKKQRRSRSRERKRSRRSRSRERGSKRDRRGGEGYDDDMDYSSVQIKQEPNGEAYDMYAGYTAAGAPPPPAAGGEGEAPPPQDYTNFAVKQEDGDDEKDHSQLPVPPPTGTDVINFTPFAAPTNEYGTYKQEEDADND